jgi:hypothetical protein
MVFSSGRCWAMLAMLGLAASAASAASYAPVELCFDVVDATAWSCCDTKKYGPRGGRRRNGALGSHSEWNLCL